MKALGWAAIVISTASGCTCGAKSALSTAPTADAPEASAAPSAPASAEGGGFDARSDRRYSAPIAAALTADGSVVVAGLVAATSVVSVTSFDRSGQTAWSRDVIPGAAWSSDVELHVLPVGHGAGIVWRGAVDGSVARHLALVGADGAAVGATTTVGSSVCATRDSLAWIERAASGPSRVRARGIGGGDARVLGEIDPEPAPTLACGDSVVFAIALGDDDLTVRPFVGGDAGAGAAVVMSRDTDFPSDDDSDNQTYTVGDRLGLVRVGESGALDLRDLEGATLSPWRRLKHAFSSDDDVLVGVDGDAQRTLLAYTHDQSDTCSSTSAGGRSAHMLVVDRASPAEDRVLLAQADCSLELGPFWTVSTSAGFGVAWVERTARAGAPGAPIRGLAYRFAGASETVHIAQPADALVEAGCDARACYAAALVRDEAMDGMTPEAVRVLRFP
jgi:hypothetical protein